MIKLLPVFSLVGLVVFCVTYLPIRRLIVYRLGISGDPTTSCCTIESLAKASGDFDESASIAFFDSKEVDYPRTSLAQMVVDQMTKPAVLGIESSPDYKWIEVSLDQQRLRAWEGTKIVQDFPISSGLWYPTPKGDFRVWLKTRFQRMTGGSKDLGTYYDLPNVPDNMFFYGSYGIHGAYWHNNFGHPMSHGCVNEPLANAAQLFDWAGPVIQPNQNSIKATSENPGTRVFIH